MKLYSYNKSFNNFIVARGFQEEKVHKFCLVNNGNWICKERLTSDVTRVSVQNARFPIGFSELACIFSGDQLNYPTGDRISLSCKWFLRNHESDPDVPVLYADLCAVRAWEKDTGMSTRPSIFSRRISILCFASGHFPFPATTRILILRRHIGTWLPEKRLLFK